MKQNRKHILLLTSEFPPQPGGIGNHAYNVAWHLSQNGFEVTVLADQRSDDGLEEEKFDDEWPFSVIRTEKKRLRFIMYLNRIRTSVKLAKTVDCIIASGKFSLWNMALCRMILKTPSIAVIHGTEVNFKSNLLRRSINLSLKQAQKIIAVSHYTKTLVDDVDLDVTVIPNGIDADKWTSVHSEQLTINGNPRLITVGNVTERKGQSNVIKHLPELKKILPDIHYHCLGIPTEATTFMKEAKQLNVQEHVSFHGRVSETQLKSFLMASDVFVMLSSETVSGDVEGFGIAIIEANALGIPAIGALGCGIEDAIEQHQSGILVRPKDTEGFVNALQTILNDPTEYRQNAERWAQKHTWNHLIKKYISVIDQL